MERAQTTVDLGVESIEIEVLETRGGRAGVTTGQLQFADSDFVIETVVVLMVDGDDRWLRGTLFDGSDLEAARAELDRLAAS